MSSPNQAAKDFEYYVLYVHAGISILQHELGTLPAEVVNWPENANVAPDIKSFLQWGLPCQSVTISSYRRLMDIARRLYVVRVPFTQRLNEASPRHHEGGECVPLLETLFMGARNDTKDLRQLVARCCQLWLRLDTQVERMLGLSRERRVYCFGSILSRLCAAGLAGMPSHNGPSSIVSDTGGRRVREPSLDLDTIRISIDTLLSEASTGGSNSEAEERFGRKKEYMRRTWINLQDSGREPQSIKRYMERSAMQTENNGPDSVMYSIPSAPAAASADPSNRTAPLPDGNSSQPATTESMLAPSSETGTQAGPRTTVVPTVLSSNFALTHYQQGLEAATLARLPWRLEERQHMEQNRSASQQRRTRADEDAQLRRRYPSTLRRSFSPNSGPPSSLPPTN